MKYLAVAMALLLSGCAAQQVHSFVPIQQHGFSLDLENCVSFLPADRDTQNYVYGICRDTISGERYEETWSKQGKLISVRLLP